jgi:hypothetical protein
MLKTISIQARSLGRPKPIVPDWYISLPDGWGGGSLTLQDLITHIVREEVAAFKSRQDRQRFIRVLTEGQIEEGRQAGRIDPAKKDIFQAVDPEDAVKTALLAFEDGLYYVFIDDRQPTALSAPVTVDENSQVLFLRLVALTGG